jgi:GNAT superfamily N-acetyltransferase
MVPAPRPAIAAQAPVSAPPVRPAAKPAAAELPSFGPSRARVTFGEPRADMMERLEAILGRKGTPRDIANLVGAAGDAEVTVEGYGAGGLWVKSVSPRYYASRRIKPGEGGRGPTIYNSLFEVDENFRGQGLGMEVFGRQIEHASKLGFSAITTHGVRGSSYNGYYTWPRFGYDGRLGVGIRSQLPDSLSHATRVSDLMASEEGIEWWKENGESIDLTFDLTPGSYSQEAFALYRRLKAKAAEEKRSG